MMYDISNKKLRLLRNTVISIVLVLILLLISGCLEPNTDSHSRSEDNPTKTELISKAKAKELSDNFVKNEMELDFYDVTVHDRDDNWVVEYVIKDEFSHRTGGGGALVEVSKKSGEIKRRYIGK